MLDVDILVNKDYLLDRLYVPEDLVVTDNNENNFHGFVDPKLKPMISRKILPNFKKLEMASIKEGLHIVVDSGYRSFDYQQKVFNKNLAHNYLETLKKNPIGAYKLAYLMTCRSVALPGSSEHQTGYAFDAGCYRDGEFSSQISDTIEAEWLNEEAYKYGFILRYPDGKTNITGIKYEPWHYRYVGCEAAYDIYNGGDWKTLEEYKLILKK